MDWNSRSISSPVSQDITRVEHGKHSNKVITLSSTDSTYHNATTCRESKRSTNRYQGLTKIKAHEKSIPTLTHR